MKKINIESMKIRKGGKTHEQIQKLINYNYNNMLFGLNLMSFISENIQALFCLKNNGLSDNEKF